MKNEIIITSGDSQLLVYFQLKCCGSVNYTDWFSSKTGKVPPSCCKEGKDSECDTANLPRVYPMDPEQLPIHAQVGILWEQGFMIGLLYTKCIDN